MDTNENLRTEIKIFLLRSNYLRVERIINREKQCHHDSNLLLYSKQT